MTLTQPGAIAALRFAEGKLYALDQTGLPWREEELELASAAAVTQAIRRLAIRGAPLIGVAAGYGVALELLREAGGDRRQTLERACTLLRDARPTAVNLARAVDRVRGAALDAPPGRAATAALEEARAIEAEEEAASSAIATRGAELLGGARRILTHCNTGALAAPGRGTAFAVLSELASAGGLEDVLVCETRPLLQGARLTVLEMARAQIPHRLVTDAAAPGLIASGRVDAVIVGCDRVAANGDVANKVGTYPLALAAREASIPFVVAGPSSSIDPACPSGAAIEIEERGADEVRNAAGQPLTLAETDCLNPAFDVTPASLVSALVTERRIVTPVDRQSLAALLEE